MYSQLHKATFAATYVSQIVDRALICKPLEAKAEEILQLQGKTLAPKGLIGRHVWTAAVCLNMNDPDVFHVFTEYAVNRRSFNWLAPRMGKTPEECAEIYRSAIDKLALYYVENLHNKCVPISDWVTDHYVATQLVSDEIIDTIVNNDKILGQLDQGVNRYLRRELLFESERSVAPEIGQGDLRYYLKAISSKYMTRYAELLAYSFDTAPSYDVKIAMDALINHVGKCYMKEYRPVIDTLSCRYVRRKDVWSKSANPEFNED